MKSIFFAFTALILFKNCNHKTIKTATIQIDTSKESYTMRAGMGASWHAIRSIYPLNNEKSKYQVREENPFGSAWRAIPRYLMCGHGIRSSIMLRSLE